MTGPRRRVGDGASGTPELPPPGSSIHLVGVAGAGMRGLAQVLAERGYRVSGCDRSLASPLPELEARRVAVRAGHDPSHVAGAALVVCSAAVPEDAPELRAAREAGIPVWKRARALAAALRGRRVVGVAGTHGKTTITAMAGLACEAAGLDPTVLVGGRVPAWGGFARGGNGEVAVVEADEYDRSFLELDPTLAVVSSVEAEHLDSYGGLDALHAAFVEFAGRAARRAGVLYCADDAGARRVGMAVGGRSYGLAAEANYRVTVLGQVGRVQHCRLAGPRVGFEFRLGAPGEHNARNAAAALAVALELGGGRDDVAESLAGFEGADRRLQVLVEVEGLGVVDDYAHHPTEVRASIAALRGRFPGHRLVVVFQPHLFSRTRDFAGEFGGALAVADLALVLPIYPAREEPIPGVSSALIAAPGGAVRLSSAEGALDRVREAAREAAAGGGRPTVFVFMGAGDVTEVARRAAAEVTDRVVGA